MGVAATNHTLYMTLHIESPLLKFLEITTDLNQNKEISMIFDKELSKRKKLYMSSLEPKFQMTKCIEWDALTNIYLVWFYHL